MNQHLQCKYSQQQNQKRDRPWENALRPVRDKCSSAGAVPRGLSFFKKRKAVSYDKVQEDSLWVRHGFQIKAVVNNVVFPVIDLILAVFFFAKLGMAYFDYRKHGQFEWTAPAILFACLIFTLTAPTYVWSILGM